MDSTTHVGLTTSYNEDSKSITFDWDPETHPQWNWLQDLTPEQLNDMLFTVLQQIQSDEENTNPSEV